jgi:hypothetical protein
VGASRCRYVKKSVAWQKICRDSHGVIDQLSRFYRAGTGSGIGPPAAQHSTEEDNGHGGERVRGGWVGRRLRRLQGFGGTVRRRRSGPGDMKETDIISGAFFSGAWKDLRRFRVSAVGPMKKKYHGRGGGKVYNF